MLSFYRVYYHSINIRIVLIVIFSCKPQQAQAILSQDGMKKALEGKLLISILAGVTMSQLTGWTSPTTKVVRAMPNTPCRVRVFLVHPVVNL